MNIQIVFALQFFKDMKLKMSKTDACQMKYKLHFVVILNSFIKEGLIN